MRVANKNYPSLDDICTLVKTEIVIHDNLSQQEVPSTFREVFCACKDINASDYYKKAVNDIKLSLVLIMDAEEYEDEKLIDFDNIRYAVFRTYQREDGLIEVTCSEM